MERVRMVVRRTFLEVESEAGNREDEVVVFGFGGSFMNPSKVVSFSTWGWSGCVHLAVWV